MARKIFISFRYSDGHLYKEKLEQIFDKNDNILNCSESEDRSRYTDNTIKSYLYSKLRGTSVTIVILTPESIEYKKNWLSNEIDDWIYDEVRYSLENRENNRPNGLIAIYTTAVEKALLEKRIDSIRIKDFNNLVRKNMFNVLKKYKTNPKENIYDSNYDHYCSLVSWEAFISNPNKYIEIAEFKRDNIDRYEIKARLSDGNHYYF